MSFELVLFDYLNEMKRLGKNITINLGGAAGPGGGTGVGGFTGVLPQSRVAYDSDEYAAYITEETPSLLDNLNHIRNRINDLETTSPYTINFRVDGALAVASGVDYAIVPYDFMIKNVRIFSPDPGDSGTTILNINKNGIPIFNESIELSCTASGGYSTQSVVATILKNSIINLDIPQIASGSSTLRVILDGNTMNDVRNTTIPSGYAGGPSYLYPGYKELYLAYDESGISDYIIATDNVPSQNRAKFINDPLNGTLFTVGDDPLLVTSYISNSVFNVTSIPMGRWSFYTLLWGENSGRAIVYVYKRDVDGLETELFNFQTLQTGVVPNTNTIMAMHNIRTMSAIPVNPMDRLVVKYYVMDGSGLGYKMLFYGGLNNPLYPDIQYPKTL